MLTRRIIPCLDVKAGRVVKGVSFVNHRDAGDPVALAALYDAAGADELVFYDITASSDERNIMVDVVEQVARQVFIPLTVGGGIRTVDDMYRMLRAGADKVSINTAAVQNPSLIEEGARRFGSQCIVLSMDARRVSEPGAAPRWNVFTHTGRDPRPTGLDATERCPSISTSVRCAPSARRLTVAMPAWPLDSEPELVDEVWLPRTDGSVLTKSPMLACGSAFSSASVTTETGVGAS